MQRRTKHPERVRQQRAILVAPFQGVWSSGSDTQGLLTLGCGVAALQAGSQQLLQLALPGYQRLLMLVLNQVPLSTLSAAGARTGAIGFLFVRFSSSHGRKRDIL